MYQYAEYVLHCTGWFFTKLFSPKTHVDIVRCGIMGSDPFYCTGRNDSSIALSKVTVFP